MTFTAQKKNISSVVKKAYHFYFGCKIGDQDKDWAPHHHQLLEAFTKKKKRTIQYPNIPSALRPVSNGEGLLIPVPPTDFSIISDEEDLDVLHNSPQALSSTCGGSKHDNDFSCFDETSSPHKITSVELNDLVRDLDLSERKRRYWPQDFNSGIFRRKCQSD
ncbi:hypothetical protein AVEN_152948-1 [Araneus ventricosus]|uniref:Uncharacterized protein n=1 Tax=Araneus ventricosus TaxID=182803 RepID=A0A4Y2AD02_ARAVE|nr:hypothetical protein AVEN_152948-1 [Araneus ventricosus]